MICMLWLSTVSFKFESYLGDFPKVSTGWPDHCCWTIHFAAISFFQEFLLKSHLLYAYYLEFDKSGWIVLMKSEILIMTGMVWPVSSSIFISILILILLLIHKVNQVLDCYRLQLSLCTQCTWLGQACQMNQVCKSDSVDLSCYSNR